MPYRSFRELRVYKEARALTSVIYSLSSRGELSRDFGLRDQIRRAVVSIVSNIAEGHERNGNREFVRFLIISKASLAELRAQLDIALDLNMINKSTYIATDEHCEKINAMLLNLIRVRRLKEREST